MRVQTFTDRTDPTPAAVLLAHAGSWSHQMKAWRTRKVHLMSHQILGAKLPPVGWSFQSRTRGQGLPGITAPNAEELPDLLRSQSPLKLLLFEDGVFDDTDDLRQNTQLRFLSG
ncbi:hypothetical protein AOLI_G00027420 [Acnodon oligacanthus]